MLSRGMTARVGLVHISLANSTSFGQLMDGPGMYFAPQRARTIVFLLSRTSLSKALSIASNKFCCAQWRRITAPGCHSLMCLSKSASNLFHSFPSTAGSSQTPNPIPTGSAFGFPDMPIDQERNNGLEFGIHRARVPRLITCRL
jgi:hypothetical protein